MKFKEYSIEQFTKDLGSSLPAPGGGGVGGLLASQGSALVSMVCQLTIGKKKYKEYEEELIEIDKEATEYTESYLNMMDEDRENFLPLAKAYGLPNKTEEEKVHKSEVMEKALKVALKTPIACLAQCQVTMTQLHRLMDIGSRLAISDVGVGAECILAAAKTSLWNIYINTKSLQSKEEMNRINGECEEKLDDIQQKYDEIRNRLTDQLKG